DLRDLFAVTEDAEGRVATQDLGSADDARAAAAVREPVIGDDSFGGQGELGVANGFRQLRQTSPTRPYSPPERPKSTLSEVAHRRAATYAEVACSRSFSRRSSPGRLAWRASFMCT